MTSLLERQGVFDNIILTKRVCVQAVYCRPKPRNKIEQNKTRTTVRQEQETRVKMPKTRKSNRRAFYRGLSKYAILDYNDSKQRKQQPDLGHYH